jgi:hypothetical protein
MTWTNETKHPSTFINDNVTGVGHWADVAVLWDDIAFTWNAFNRTVWANESKSVATTGAGVPFFGWLFLFTQPGSVVASNWINDTKH